MIWMWLVIELRVSKEEEEAEEAEEEEEEEDEQCRIWVISG